MCDQSCKFRRPPIAFSMHIVVPCFPVFVFQLMNGIVWLHNDTHISTRDSAHDFIVKFSPSVCVAIVASLT